MTPVIKTYSRARTAAAALRKILDMHEVPVINFELDAYEVEPGRFAARVFLNGYGLAAETLTLLENDLLEAGFEFETKNAVADILGAEEVVDASAVLQEDDTSPMMAEEEAREAAEALEQAALDQIAIENAGSSTYVKEVSTFKGATKMVWTIADNMVGASRKDVIEACRRAGIAYGTARTQYQKWYATQPK